MCKKIIGEPLRRRRERRERLRERGAHGLPRPAERPEVLRAAGPRPRRGRHGEREVPQSIITAAEE